MSTEDEESLKACLEVYKEQLRQVESSLNFVDGETSEADDLVQLRDDLKQLLQLTEQSLVSLKKSKLLSMLSEQSTVSASNCTANDKSDSNDGQSSSSFNKDAGTLKGSNNPSTSESNMDDEFYAFQLAVQSGDNRDENLWRSPTEIRMKKNRNGQSDSESEYSDDSNDSSENKNDCKDNSFDEMSGKKCRVSYSHSWGELTDHNAMIIQTERSDDKQTSANMARVVFLNPTHRSMQTCPYFLDDKCRFSDEDCRYSHGTVVSLSDLKLFKEPDFTSVCIGCRCLALDADGIWYPATVVDVLTDNKYHVQFDITLLLRFVDLHDILPIDDNDTELENDISDSDQTKKIIEIIDSESDEDDVKIVPFQEKPNGATTALGQWEKHTRGIGSKLMARMGYISGQGLGKYGEGRSEPVPAELLPKGKSLDKIMELREKDCGRSSNNGMIKKSQRSKQLLKASLQSKLKTLPKSSSASSVFDFLNSKLGTSTSKYKNNDCQIVEKSSAINAKHISVNDLKSKSDRDLNIELFKTQEEIQSARNSICKLKESLKRTEQQDPTAARKIRSKLTSMQQYVTQMETSVNYMQQHADNRKAHKILIKF